MKYLDEVIEIQVTGTIAGTATGIYQYRVQRKNDSANTWADIFIGNMYHQYGTAFKVDITDIVRNDSWIPDESVLYGTTGTSYSVKLVNTYRVAFYTSGTATNSSAVQVAKVYRNPHKFAYIGNSPFFDYTISGNVSFPLQGRYNSGGIGYFYLTPRYPYLSTTNYRLLLSSEESSNVSSSYLKVVGKMVGNQRTIPFTYPSSFVSYNLSDLYSDLAPSNYTGSFGHFHQGISDDFNVDADAAGNAIVTANEQNDCFFKFVRFDNNRDIVQEYTNGWIDAAGGVYIGQITLDNSFFSANDNGGLAIMFARAETANIPNVDNSGGWIEYSFAIPHDIIDIISGRTVDFRIDGHQISWMAKWQVDKFNISIGYWAGNDKTLVEVAGDIVAQIDTDCNSRYYLQWKDRLGGFQSQPFNEHYTYSENFERETITNYKGVKRVSNINITSKFKVNTDWIREDYYPFYESIFTSPVLFLYDTLLDKRYSVLVTDSEYTEKTYDNQKKLFNLSLNLELNQQQNIIY